MPHRINSVFLLLAKRKKRMDKFFCVLLFRRSGLLIETRALCFVVLCRPH